MSDHLDQDELDALAALMPTPEEITRMRDWPLGTDEEVDALRMRRLEQILEAQSGVLARANGAVQALILAWQDAQPTLPSPVARAGEPVDVGEVMREAVAADPEFFAAARKKMCES